MDVRWTCLWIAIGAAIACAPSPARSEHVDPASTALHMSTLVDVKYGPEPRQKLDIYLPSSTPLATFVFVPGGAWTSTDKASYASVGHRFALDRIAALVIDYRLAPRARAAEQADDVARAIAFLFRNADRFGLSRRIFVGGHSAGAHLAALSITDKHFFAAHAVPDHAVAGVVLLSGIYDLEAATNLPLDALFSTASARRDASPIRHIGACTTHWLLMAGEREPESLRLQARTFYDAQRSRQCEAELEIVAGADHRDMVLELVERGSPINRRVMEFVGADSSGE